ncbi:MAG: outer membrane protein assembly factor BamC [Acidithiobacillus sp.]|nr:outer membrane protein assembly factor BamC [Acidithiobacillus sp.]
MRPTLSRGVILVSVLSVGLSGCSYLPFLKNNTGPSYTDAKLLKPLAVPPDLLAAAPEPGVAVPGGAPTPGEAVQEAGMGSASQAGYGVFTPRLAPGESPVAENATPGVQSVLLGSGKDLALQSQAPAAQIWAAVRATLAARKVGVQHFDPAKAILVSGWVNERHGFSAIFHGLAPSSRMQFTFHLQPKGNDQQLLTVVQQREWINPSNDSVDWTPTVPDLGANRKLLEEVQKQLQKTVVMAQMPRLQVTRYRDDQGPYLLLDQPPVKAQPAVQMALGSLDHPVQNVGVGEWTVQIHNGKPQETSNGILGGMFTRAWHSIQMIWGGGKAPKPLSVQVKLLATKDPSTSVLETEPGEGNPNEARKAAIEVLDQLQNALHPRSGTSS